MSPKPCQGEGRRREEDKNMECWNHKEGVEKRLLALC